MPRSFAFIYLLASFVTRSLIYILCTGGAPVCLFPAVQCFHTFCEPPSQPYKPAERCLIGLKRSFGLCVLALPQNVPAAAAQAGMMQGGDGFSWSNKKEKGAFQNVLKQHEQLSRLGH